MRCCYDCYRAATLLELLLMMINKLADVFRGRGMYVNVPGYSVVRIVRYALRSRVHSTPYTAVVYVASIIRRYSGML